MVPVRESGDVADFDQEQNGAGGADPGQVGEVGTGCGEGGSDLLVGVLLALIDGFEVGDEFQSEGFAGLPCGVFRA